MAVATYDSKWDAMTLYSSFENEVLVLTPPPTNLRVPNIDINKKGSSTQQAKPPMIWFPRAVAHYLQRAGDLRRKHEDTLSGSYLPAPYVPCVLNSESDIVQASVLWLLHPVIKALQAEYPSAVCSAEVTIDDCRCDALISIANKPLVVVEYKNRGNLKRAEFDQARVDDPTEGNKQHIRGMMAVAEQNRLRSAMGSNAACLTKQAAAYSLKWETRYVALFDWDGLFLWNFAGANFEPPLVGRGGATGAGAGRGVVGHADWAYGTWVHNRAHYRAALLGFVLEAVTNRRHPTFRRNGAPAPWEPSQATKDKRRREAEAKRLDGMNAQQQTNHNLYAKRRD